MKTLKDILTEWAEKCPDELDLSHINLSTASEDDQATLLRLLTEDEKPLSINLVGSHLHKCTPDFIDALFNAISLGGRRHIKKLDLTSNRLGHTDHADVLCIIATRLTTANLSELIVSNNAWESMSSSAIEAWEGMISCPSLTSLTFGCDFSKMSDPALISAMFNAIAKATSLTNLEIPFAPFGDNTVACEAFLDAFTLPEAVKEFTLARTQFDRFFGPESVLYDKICDLACCIASAPGLTRLSLLGTGLCWFVEGDVETGDISCTLFSSLEARPAPFHSLQLGVTDGREMIKDEVWQRTFHHWLNETQHINGLRLANGISHFDSSQLAVVNAIIATNPHLTKHAENLAASGLAAKPTEALPPSLPAPKAIMHEAHP